MQKSRKQNIFGGIAVTCLLVIAPGLASEKHPLAPVAPIMVAALCCHFGELDKIEGAESDEK